MSDIAIFKSDNGEIQVKLEKSTVWLTQRQMGDVFETTPENILMHLKNMYLDNELEESATTKDFLVVQTEGNRQVKRNLIGVGLVTSLEFGR